MCDRIDADKVREYYKYYRFQEVKTSTEKILAFKHSLYFNNIDVVPVNSDVTTGELEKIKSEFERINYTCKTNQFRSIEEIQTALFRGFFNWDGTRDFVRKSHDDFVQKRISVIGSTYSYIPSAFISDTIYSYNASDPVGHVLEVIQKPGPCLILIEAPAGYGKTTAMYELCNKIISSTTIKAIPLLAELHRNRKVPEFKYVLLDEFNRVFNGIEYGLAIRHVQRGDIILIVDGFDEMIRSNYSTNGRSVDDKSINEPLLYTIAEIIKNNAKVILTTRKTVFAEKDYFKKWYDDCRTKCQIERISIQNPSIEDWLGRKRIIKAVANRVDFEKVSNPILLASLRRMNDDEFESALNDPGGIIERFIDDLLNRETERQNLRIDSNNQRKIFQGLAQNFSDHEISEETKEYITELIRTNDKSKEIIKESLNKYWSTEGGATVDQILEKLTLHCVLDKRGFTDAISFVSDFLFGYFLGTEIISNNSQVIILERYIDLATQSYSALGEEAKTRLWNALQPCLDVHDTPIKVITDLRLKGELLRDIENCSLSNLDLDDEQFDNKLCKCVQFFDCKFHNISFIGKNIVSCNFVHCEFYGCEWVGERDENTFINTNWKPEDRVGCGTVLGTDFNANTKILERFWPKGRPNFQICKKESTLFCGIPPEQGDVVKSALSNLVKSGLLTHSSGNLYWLNMNRLDEIKQIIGR